MPRRRRTRTTVLLTMRASPEFHPSCVRRDNPRSLWTQLTSARPNTRCLQCGHHACAYPASAPCTPAQQRRTGLLLLRALHTHARRVEMGVPPDRPVSGGMDSQYGLQLEGRHDRRRSDVHLHAERIRAQCPHARRHYKCYFQG
jgi:hypothetical protein